MLTVYLKLEPPPLVWNVCQFSHANIKSHKSKNRFISVSQIRLIKCQEVQSM